MYAKTMTDEITQTRGEFENVAANGDVRDWDADANRWTQGDNDRLYVDGTKFVDYVALDSLIVMTQGSGVSATAEIDGGVLRLTVTRDDGINHKEMSATFELPDDLSEREDGDGDSAGELAADGGQERTEHFDDEDIEQAIEQNATDAAIGDVRDVLADAQRGFERLWDAYMDVVEEGTFELVTADRDVLVFADHGGREWREIFDQEAVGDAGLRSAVMQVQHATADRHADYSWATADPVVIRKPSDFEAGRRFVEAVVNSLQDRGLSPGQAWAYYGVEICGNSMKSWGGRKGDHDHKNVSDAVQKAREKLP